MNRATIKKRLYQLSTPLTIQQLIRLTNQRIIFPFYHAVSNDPPTHLKHVIKVPSEKRFIDDIEYLLKNFEPATLQDVLSFDKRVAKKNKPKFYLTFDDGFSECYHVIAPILEKYGLEATFFINPQFIDNKSFSHRLKISLLIKKVKNDPSIKSYLKKLFLSDNYNDIVSKLKKLTINDLNLIDKIDNELKLHLDSELRKKHRYLTTEQVLSLKKRGFSIGSHSLSHPEFHLIDKKEQKKEIASSFELLEKMVNPEKRLFSFPFSDDGVTKNIFDYLHNELNVAATFGTAGLKKDDFPHHFHRIAMEDFNFNSAKQIIQSEYIYYLAKSFLGKNVKQRL